MVIVGRRDIEWLLVGAAVCASWQCSYKQSLEAVWPF